MFFKAGRKSWRLKHYNYFEKRCESCKTFSIEGDAYRDYFHLYWIPMFPLGKRYAQAYCAKCYGAETSEIREIISKKRDVFGWYFYIGSIMLVYLIFATIYYENIKENNTKEFLNHPKVNDVYSLHDNRFTSLYFFLKLIEQRDDTPIFYPSKHSYLKSTAGMGTDDCFVRDSCFFSKKQLKEMYNKGKIKAVYRNYNAGKGICDE